MKYKMHDLMDFNYSHKKPILRLINKVGYKNISNFLYKLANLSKLKFNHLLHYMSFTEDEINYCLNSSYLEFATLIYKKKRKAEKIFLSKVKVIKASYNEKLPIYNEKFDRKKLTGLINKSAIIIKIPYNKSFYKKYIKKNGNSSFSYIPFSMQSECFHIYQTKGKNCFKIYGGKHSIDVNARLNITTYLQKSISNKLFPLFQIPRHIKSFYYINNKSPHINSNGVPCFGSFKISDKELKEWSKQDIYETINIIMNAVYNRTGTAYKHPSNIIKSINLSISKEHSFSFINKIPIIQQFNNF